MVEEEGEWPAGEAVAVVVVVIRREVAKEQAGEEEEEEADEEEGQEEDVAEVEGVDVPSLPETKTQSHRMLRLLRVHPETTQGTSASGLRTAPFA